MPATRDQIVRRARVGEASVRVSPVVASAYGRGALMRWLLVCVLFIGVPFINGCSASAPSTGNTTTATTASPVTPLTAERAGEVRANGQPAPTAATGAVNSSLQTAQETTQGAPAGVADTTQQTASTNSSAQDGAEASAAYEGFYEVLGARPKGFEQFGNFMIRAPKQGRISGAVVPLEGELYEFARATLAGGKLTFVTQKVGGVHYSFDGQFLAAPPFAGNKKVAVAEGLVKKFRGEQVTAEASMKFYYDEGGEGP